MDIIYPIVNIVKAIHDVFFRFHGAFLSCADDRVFPVDKGRFCRYNGVSDPFRSTK